MTTPHADQILRRRALLVVLTIVTGLAAALLTGAPQAAAHTDLTASDPAGGSRVAAPEAITLVFTDDVHPTLAQVTLAVDGAEPIALDSRVTGSEVRTTPPAVTAATQQWTIAYRVVAGDGHPITGGIAFTVTGTKPASSTPTPTPTRSPSPAGPATSPTPTTATASPTSTVRPGFPPETDNHANRSPRWFFVVIMGALLLVAPIMASLLRLPPDSTEGDNPPTDDQPEHEPAEDEPAEDVSAEDVTGPAEQPPDGAGGAEKPVEPPAAVETSTPTAERSDGAPGVDEQASKPPGADPPPRS